MLTIDNLLDLYDDEDYENDEGYITLISDPFARHTICPEEGCGSYSTPHKVAGYGYWICDECNRKFTLCPKSKCDGIAYKHGSKEKIDVYRCKSCKYKVPINAVHIIQQREAQIEEASSLRDSGYTIREIAKIQGVPSSTVHKRIGKRNTRKKSFTDKIGIAADEGKCSQCSNGKINLDFRETADGETDISLRCDKCDTEYTNINDKYYLPFLLCKWCNGKNGVYITLNGDKLLCKICDRTYYVKPGFRHILKKMKSEYKNHSPR